MSMSTIIMFVLIVITVLIGLVIMITRLSTTKKKGIDEFGKVEESAKPETESKSIITNSNIEIEVVVPKYAYTHGESAFYKEKLNDQRWIDIRNSVLSRDKYVCQHCHNCIDDIVMLKNLSELLPYTEYNQSLYNFISDVFSKNDDLISKFTTNKPAAQINKENILKTYNDNLKVYIYSKIEKSDKLGLFGYGNKRAHTQIISSDEKDVNNLKWQHSDWLSNYNFYNNNNQLKFQNAFINYYPDVQTNQVYYLKFNYGHAYAPFNGQWSLHKDGFVVSFDGSKKLKHKNLGLNVHHKIYSNTGNPWDCKLDDLVTLCRKCHIAEHERVENKIPIKSI